MEAIPKQCTAALTPEHLHLEGIPKLAVYGLHGMGTCVTVKQCRARLLVLEEGYSANTHTLLRRSQLDEDKIVIL